MANPNQLALLKQDVQHWNKWRLTNAPEPIKPDLSGANLTGANLSRAYLDGVNLTEADLTGADLSGADLTWANLTGAFLAGAFLNGANLFKADLTGAHLDSADLYRADLTGANLTEANLTEAYLHGASLIDANLDRADLSGASIFGISAWNMSLEGTIQKNLIIQRSSEEAPITLDDLEVAQFIYLILNSRRVRSVIDTITSKVVLILGRFTPERKAILDALRAELRRRNYLPILFDFEKPTTRDLTETVSMMAHMARFVIADLTDAKSLPQELTRIVPILPSVPVQPILLASEKEWAMYSDLASYPWVLPTASYKSQESLMAGIQSQIIDPAEKKATEQMERRKVLTAR